MVESTSTLRTETIKSMVQNLRIASTGVLENIALLLKTPLKNEELAEKLVTGLTEILRKWSTTSP